MNLTQKSAWYNIAAVGFGNAAVSYVIFQLGIRKMAPPRIAVYILLLSCVLLVSIILLSLRKKQSPNEPDSDERDKQIYHRAILVAFFSAIPLFLLASAAPPLFVGIDGYVPVWSLPLVTLFLFSVVLIIYSVAILVQYGRGGKTNE